MEGRSGIKNMKQESEMSRKTVPVSVIVPVYNTERYLAKCLDSIIAQTMRDIEIICVDDGSTDSSLEILTAYAGKDARIRVIHKENGGLVSARKAGVKAARGTYIGYVDSDDWIEPRMYERLYECAEEYRADMVSSGYLLEGNYCSTHFDGVPEGLYDTNNMGFLRENVFFCAGIRDVGIRGSLCCKIFLRDKFQEAQLNIPEDITLSEDKLCVVSYLLVCERVSVLKEAFYHYVVHPESMVHTPNVNYLMKVNAVYQYFISLYQHPAFTEAMRLQAELYITEMLYKGINSRLGFLNENLLWIDPYWMGELPEKSRVLLYGAGALGRKYYQQIQNRKGLFFAGCIDFGYERMQGYPFAVRNPADWEEIEFDAVVITVKNIQEAEKVRGRLCAMGIRPSMIYHFEQKELFWRFAEADGILQ